MMRVRRARWLGAVGLLLAGLIAGTTAMACDDDNSEASAAEIQEVEDILRDVVGSDGSNAEFFFAHVTDNVIESVLFSTREECEANAVECIGEPLPVTGFTGTRIDGDRATSVALVDFTTLELGVIREAGVWKVDSVQAASDEVPAGATVVDLELVDFAFGFDRSAIPADGNFAFHVTNNGQQMHEVVVVGIPPGEDLEGALAAVESEEAAPLAAKVYARPGQSFDMAFDEPLAPGNYALVCFFPDTTDPEFTGHIEKGMVAEFTVE